MSSQQNPLRLNVGFIVHEDIGYTRDFNFDLPELRLPPDLDLAGVSGRLRLSRTQQGLVAEGRFSAHTPLECARCLDPVDQALTTDFTELYAFDERSTDESDLILPATGIIDFGPVLREYMFLAMPITPLCKPGCLGLCPTCGENRNNVDCGHTQESIDPRFESLKDFLKDEDE
jgi:uncharacterized protein